jgi:ABC-type transport system involved in multi-copper enzyme maturation permease subunit
MRPYLAILIDSFREATHSRVLGVVLICITLLFLGLFPLHLQEHVTTGLRNDDVIDWPDLAGQLLAAGRQAEGKPPPPIRYVWDHLDENARDALPKLLPLQQAARGLADLAEFRQAERTVVRSLRKQMEDVAWHDSDAFAGVKLGREGRTIRRRIDAGEEVSEVERQRLNRLMLEAIFPASVAVSPSRSYSPAYAWIDSEQPLPWNREQINDTLPSLVVLLMDWLFGVFGILVALLVTASIIPQMFEPGSLHLLLSKPISRSLLFLTKFLGGCVFAVVSAAYFSVGIWLILGVRFDVWDARLLAAVPIYGFVFAIYYSVTALAGVVFRNTIVAVVLGVVFWLVCFGIGTAESFMTTFVVDTNRITHLTTAEDALLATMSTGVYQWDAEQREWTRVYRSQAEGGNTFNQTLPEWGPFYDSQHDQLVSLQRSMFRGSDNAVSVAPRSERWPRTRAASLPAGTVAIALDRQSRVLALTLDGIYRSTKNVASGDEAPKIFGISLPLGNSAAFAKITAGSWPFGQQPVTAAIDPATDAMVIYSRGRVGVWHPTAEGTYAEAIARTLEASDEQPMLAAIGGGRVLLAARDGRLLLLNSETLDTVEEFHPEGNNAARQLRVSTDGKQMAVLFAHGVLWTIETESNRLQQAKVPGQTTISAVTYAPDGALLVVHHVNRVSRIAPASGNSEMLARPSLTTAQRMYHYLVHPLYVVLPKPGELYRTLLYVMTGKETTFEPPRRAASSEVEFQQRLHPWQPVLSGGAFLAVMLAAGCIYLNRMEF